jgi:hypothetical protein
MPRKGHHRDSGPSISKDATDAARTSRRSTVGAATNSALPIAPAHLSTAQVSLLARWDAHLAKRCVTIPDVEDFRTFGSISQLEKLRIILAVARPNGCGALRLAVRSAHSGKWRKSHPDPETPATRKPRVRARISVPEADLPRAWRRALKEMRELRATWDRGLLSVDDRMPPTARVIKNLASTLRIYAKACLDAGLPVDLTPEAVDRWREARYKASNKQVTIASRLKELVLFAVWLDLDEEVIARLGRLKTRHLRAARGAPTRKGTWLVENETDPSHVWDRAEELLALAMAAPPGSAARARLTLDAACLALSVVCPLRSGDLHRVEFGTHLRRHPAGWSLQIDTDKTGLTYHRPQLWDELTPVLDALVTLDMPGLDVWTAYERREGTPIFSRDGGTTGVAVGWPSQCWRRHFGIGAHIIRTLWHSWTFASEDDEQYVALVLSGQTNARTAEHYVAEGARQRASRRGRGKVQEARRRNAARTIGNQGAAV